ncbi:glycoside hydrolase family 3 protein [Actinomadura parmotrematis]|uniref:Glycoside hydrolase family 3 C-terminal domain-containing protein n=1 Tax=Actinomadura parmotrematis TaxID=2864039 RepID=A0ABS7G060_9ACTN|nr:glycoside hydrolase family 3 C-terminal domain-containing protein [Actinomadura parmotrematis]MBW8486094.1 glycoside hydrolase family 3 C-terminal domain-containing protein [Actinomadura parmotrematis]
MPVDESDLRDRLARLTLEEKTGLLTGADFWTLPAVERIGLRALVMSDGPSGVRGRSWDERETGLLFPNPSALAATWDVALAERAGRLNGAQARDRGVHVQLAPTVNLHRTPLGGRHFENYAEDPLLTGRIGAAFVAGVQSAGVAATAKHFVGNDSETDRMTYRADIPAAALETLYLRPFEDAVRAGAWAVMAAYNGVGGVSMTENRPLLTGLLKDRWGFDGVVVSDWFAVRSTEASANAGLDVEMPGGPRARWRDRLAEAVRAGRVAAELVDDKVLRVLRLAARTGALDGHPAPPPATTPPDARDRLRSLAATATVLLANDRGVLPLAAPRRVALIGPNAVRFSAQGGGSAHVTPEHVVTPLEGLRAALGDGAEIEVRAGVYPHERLAPLPLEITADPETGEPGVRLEYLDGDGAVLASEHRRAAAFKLIGGLPEGTRRIRARTAVTVAEDGAHTFAVTGIGRFELDLDGATTVIEQRLPEGADAVEALVRPPEHRVEAELKAGRRVAVELRHELRPGGFGVVLGLGHWAPHLDEDAELAASVRAAAAADAVIVMVGTNDDVESEGFDRATLRLPGRQDELVRAVAAARPDAVVVVNAGAPVLTPWRGEVGALLWAWLPGQEGGAALADVLTGAAEPGGRLPTTHPATEEHLLPVVPDGDGTLAYTEGTSIGYRHYAAADIAYPFGHGLGYTTWEYDALSVEDGVAEVLVRNAGDRPGREVVQLYAFGEGTPIRLAGFAVVEAGPGESAAVRVPLDDRLPAAYHLQAGRSIADLRLATEVG